MAFISGDGLLLTVYLSHLNPEAFAVERCYVIQEPVEGCIILFCTCLVYSKTDRNAVGTFAIPSCCVLQAAIDLSTVQYIHRHT